MAGQGGSKLSPLPVLAGLLVVMGGVGLLRDRESSEAMPGCAPEADAACDTNPAPSGEPGQRSAPVLDAAEACQDVGYLCAELATTDRIRLRRWRDFSGTVVVHVPRPDFEDRGEAARLQEAAARGL
ncbi:MAG: hypothetical protein OEN00_15595, partial [Gemmatimonadota bacterium]|nr:hypothetical protein [Gemmatimonadota bacterium]